MATPNTYIKWSYWGGGGTLIDYGQMPLTDVQKHIQRFEKEAKKLLDEKSNECGWDAVDHVVYAIKTRDEDGKLAEVRFYMTAMNDKRFDVWVSELQKGEQIYALHKMK